MCHSVLFVTHALITEVYCPVLGHLVHLDPNCPYLCLSDRTARAVADLLVTRVATNCTAVSNLKPAGAPAKFVLLALVSAQGLTSSSSYVHCTAPTRIARSTVMDLCCSENASPLGDAMAPPCGRLTWIPGGEAEAAAVVYNTVSADRSDESN